MKTYTKISSLAVVCALYAGASMPASAAPSVRALGGAGTFSSASSATQAKSGTTSSVQKADTVRGGSLAVGNTGATTTTAKKATTTSNVNSGLRGSSVRSASVRVPSTARLSIGKYLGGSTVSTPPKQCIPGDPDCERPTEVDYKITYDPTTKVLEIYDEAAGEMIMSRGVASHRELVELQNLVGSGELDTSAETIIAAINELVAGKQDKLTAGDGIAIDDNEISVRVGEGLDIRNGVIVTDIDAPIQKQIIQGKGIEILVGAKEDAVKVKLAEKDSNLTFDSDGGLRVDLPEGGVQEKLEAGTGISQAELDAGKIGVNILPNGEGGLVVQDGYLQTAIDLPKVPVQEKLTAGTGIKIADNVISTNLESGSPSNLTIVTDPNTGKQTISVVGLANADGIIEYKQGNGIAISGDNQISANIGSGLRFNESTGAIETVVEVQEKLTQGAGITIENNVVSANLKQGEGILISDEDGAKKITFDSSILPDGPVQKQIVEGNGIQVVEGEKSDTVQIKLADGNSGLEFVDGGLKVSSDANTTYVAGNGIAISEDNKITISANADGLYLYSFAGGTGTWSMVDVVDENDVPSPTPVAE